MNADALNSIVRIDLFSRRAAELERFVAVCSVLGQVIRLRHTELHEVAVAKLLEFGFGKSVLPTST